MNDTMKMARPWFERRDGGPQGRVEHDERGNAVWVRTRASDAEHDVPVPSDSLSLVGELPAAMRGGLRKAQVSYFEHAGPDEGEPARRRPRDLRALSRWIEARKAAAGSHED